MEKNTVNEAQIEALFKVGAHYGFSKSRRHPSMAPYIFGVKNKIEIFDLEKVSELIDGAKAFMEEAGAGRKKVLFVGGKNEARDAVRQAAGEIGMPYVASRWIGGTLTNFSEIKKRINRLSDLTEKRSKGELSKFTKLEQLHIDREIEELENVFGGAKTLEGLPYALVVVDTKQEAIAVKEAKKMHIPVVGILNSDCNATGIDHHIAGNDASAASISYFLNELAASYAAGLKRAPVETKKEEEREGGADKDA